MDDLIKLSSVDCSEFLGEIPVDENDQGIVALPVPKPGVITELFQSVQGSVFTSQASHAILHLRKARKRL